MEKIKEVYLDSTVFITASLNTNSVGRKARDILNAVDKQLIEGYTSTLTFDEVVFIVRKLAGFEKSLAVGDAFLKIQYLRFIDVTYGLVLLAQELIRKYKIKPRDAIHAACASDKGIKFLISDDSDFDIIKEINRKDIDELKF